MKIIQMIIEKHYNRTLRMLKCDPLLKTHIKYFLCPHKCGLDVKIFLLNKMNTDIKQGS